MAQSLTLNMALFRVIRDETSRVERSRRPPLADEYRRGNKLNATFGYTGYELPAHWSAGDPPPDRLRGSDSLRIAPLCVAELLRYSGPAIRSCWAAEAVFWLSTKVAPVAPETIVGNVPRVATSGLFLILASP